MKRVRIAAAVLGTLAAVAWVGADRAGAEEMSIKQMMGENFAGLQQILAALITSNYQAVPHQLDVIEAHANRLEHSVPESAKGDRERFLSYAYNLQGHASDLKSIIAALMAHDKATSPGQALPTDQLREAAAAHYGGMVTMCVSCHNRFRPTVVQ
jgi:hypothetical protein